MLQLTDKVQTILNNFKGIHSNILLTEGNVIKTISSDKSLRAYATIDQNIDREIGIADLSQFMSSLGLINNPKVKIEENHFLISDSSGLSWIKYFFASKSVLTYPEGTLTMPEADITFPLTASVLKQIKQAAGTFASYNLRIKGTEGSVELAVCDPEDAGSSSYSQLVEGKYNEECTMNINIEHFLFLPLDYQVSISKRGLAEFKSKSEDFDITYYITLNV